MKKNNGTREPIEYDKQYYEHKYTRLRKLLEEEAQAISEKLRETTNPLKYIELKGAITSIIEILERDNRV